MAFADGTSSTIAQDGIEDDDSVDDAGLNAPAAEKLGFILEEKSDKKIAKHMVKLREDQNDTRSRNRAVWKRNVWWREGRRGVRLEKKQDAAQWEAKLPIGSSSAPPTPNKTDRLCRRLTNTIIVDEPFPECEPGGDDNQDRDAAEFATRYLTVKGAAAELNMKRVVRSAMDKAQTYASAFAWVTMDPTGGGHRPRTMLAHPAAPHRNVALQDPETGLRADDADLTNRYVMPDGTLQDDAVGADIQWLPGEKIRILNGLQLDLLPATARDIAEAVGVVITDTTTLGDLRAMFPDVMGTLTDEQIKTLCEWRPSEIEDILPPYTTEPEDQKEEGDSGKFKDSQMVVTTTVYYRSCAEYPWGCYAVAGGESIVLHKERLCAKMETPEGQMEEECLDIPVAQCRCLDDDTSDNPMGIGIVEFLGPSDEVRFTALAAEMEHMFRAGNPIPFLPHGSIVRPGQLKARDGSAVMVNPNGKVEWEVVPPLSESIPNLREEMTTEMNDISGLQQAAQGVEDPSVQSGIHAQTIVQEALKAVTNMKDNAGDFYIRVNQIILQLARAYRTVPELLSYIGKNGEYKQKEFSRTDFRKTKRVSIKRGSYTMHTLIAKQEMADRAFDRKVIDAEDYQDLIAGGVSPVLGIQDNPHLLRVRTQIDKFMDGPTPEWTQAIQVMKAAQQQAADLAAVQGALAAQQQPAPQGQPIPDGGMEQAPPVAAAPPAPPAATALPPAPPNPFSNRLPIDLEPMPAKIRHRQLSRNMADGKFETFPDEWKAPYLAEYADMANAAGIMTVPQIQAAKAAEQKAAAEAAAADQQFKQTIETEKLKIEQQRLTVDQDKLVLDEGRTADSKAKEATATGAGAPPVARAIEHQRDAAGNIVSSIVKPAHVMRIDHQRDAAGRVVASHVSQQPNVQ